MRCRHCGNARDEARETVPYVGPGSRVVELRDMHVMRCRVCPNMTIEVPEPSHLDTLIRCLGAEIDGPLPQLAYEMGHWCILPRPSMASEPYGEGSVGHGRHRASPTPSHVSHRMYAKPTT
jgi:hypothetical protein